MENRRYFIKKTALGLTSIGISGNSLCSFSKTNNIRITILHTNDTHSQIEPLPKNHYKFPGLGGFVKRATLIEKIRKENSNTLLFDAGDIFQGSPYFNYFGGNLECKLMSLLNYDAVTLGNHDFDNGLNGILKQLINAKFSFLSANYNFRNTILDGHIKPYTIFTKQGIKIGVFGLGINLEGIVNKSLYKETIFLSPIDIAKDMATHLKKAEKCNLIICLSHLGYYYKNNPHKICDIELAKKTKYIDLIIGGHTHTLLKKPTIIKNSINKDVLINQCGKSGIYMGKIDFYISKSSKISKAENILII